LNFGGIIENDALLDFYYAFEAFRHPQVAPMPFHRV
jgi:hypothetical protein